MLLRNNTFYLLSLLVLVSCSSGKTILVKNSYTGESVCGIVDNTLIEIENNCFYKLKGRVKVLDLNVADFEESSFTIKKNGSDTVTVRLMPQLQILDSLSKIENARYYNSS